MAKIESLTFFVIFIGKLMGWLRNIILTRRWMKIWTTTIWLQFLQSLTFPCSSLSCKDILAFLPLKELSRQHCEKEYISPAPPVTFCRVSSWDLTSLHWRFDLKDPYKDPCKDPLWEANLVKTEFTLITHASSIVNVWNSNKDSSSYQNGDRYNSRVIELLWG